MTNPKPKQPSLTWLLAGEILRQKSKGPGITETGWKALQSEVTTKNVALSEKEIFFAGAGYIFSAIMAVMDDDREPSASDLAVMTRLFEELSIFDEGLRRKFLTTKGNKPS